MTVTQASFTLAVMDPARPTPPGLTNPNGQPATRRFDVYRNNVAVSLTEALEQAFPTVRKLLGESNFRVLAGAYLRTHPPETPLMMHYGTAMPDYLSDFPPVRSMGYLPDMARLDLAIRRSYHASDHQPIAPEDLQGLSPDRLLATRLRLAPSARIVRSPWPIFGIWDFNARPGAPKPQAQAENVLILRNEFDPQPIPISDGAAIFLLAVRAGVPIGAAHETALRDAPDFDLSSLLTTLFAAGALANPLDGPCQ